MSDTQNAVSTPEIANANAEAQYRLLQPKYEKLAMEAEYIIRDALVEEGVPIASVSKRVKSVSSFAGKLRRKSYADPLSEVADFAGVRIVSYFRGDLTRLEQMIRRLFDVVEKVDKAAELEPDQFGYNAVQFIVRLRGSYSGARYDDLHKLKCEIQTRAVLADAWSILNHHLVYKKEGNVPPEVSRRVNRLAAIVEDAEAGFDEIRKEIQALRDKGKPAVGDDFLAQPINPSTVAAYIERRHPGIPTADNEQQAAFICSLMDSSRFHTLADIEDAMRRTEKAVLALKKDTGVYPGQEVEYALAFVDPSRRHRYADWFAALFRKHRDLVEGADRGAE